MPCANKKGAHQPAYPCCLISAFVVRYLDCIIPILANSEIPGLYLASVAEQSSLSLTWLQIPEDRFSHDMAKMSQGIAKPTEQVHMSTVNTQD